MSRLILFLFTLIAAAHATSLEPVLHQCPVCEAKSVRIALMSYSNFGEAARDLSDSPRYSFSEVEICPNDLFAGWGDSWKSMKPEEKAKLAAFLKQPTLHLTDKEKAIIAGHEDKFRKSCWFPPVWARTCNSIRSLGPRERFECILRLHYKGVHVGTRPEANDLEKRLTAHYREQAITALVEAQTAEWPSPLDKRVFAYLHAEFTRQAGRDDEAHALFQKVIQAETAMKPDEDSSWVLAWAQEQSLRCGPESKDLKLLSAIILPKLPDPWRSEKTTNKPEWPRHYAAVDILARQASSGNKPSSDALWELLDRKPERLLAFLETTNTNISALRAVDPRWRDWFDEISALLTKEQLPPSLAKDPNPERVINVLGRAVEPNHTENNPDPWYKNVLLPEVRTCVVKGGIPNLPITEKQLYPGLPLSMLDKDDKPGSKPAPPSPNKVGRALYELWQQLAAAERTDVARVYVRILRQLDDSYESFEYPVMYLLPEIAETEPGRGAIRAEMDGPWKSSFWKAACAYAAGMENSGDAFVNHPVSAKGDDSLIVKLLLQKSDPSWKNTALKKLREDEYISDEILRYLVSLNLPETRKALDEFAKDTRNAADDRDNGRLYRLRDLDEALVENGLGKIPIR